MTRRILKYTLTHQRRQTIDLPAGSFVSHVHDQDGLVCLWVIRPAGLLLTHKRQVTCLSTSKPVPDDAGRYIGTAHVHGGRTVVHVFLQEEP